MRRAIASVALVLALVLAPAAGAYHYSVGTQDAAGVSPDETPGDADTSKELYERGTTRECTERPRDVQDADQAARQTPATDPFCGRLVYQADTDLEQVAPRDQRILLDGWTFDVVATSYVGTYELDTCYPWCAPGGVTALDALEGVLQTAAPDVFAGDHEDESDHGHQSYAVDLRLPAAGTVLQREAGVGQGSGWALPTTETTFVAFLQDKGGDAVGEDRFDRVVSDLAGERLPEDATALVCGFSPDFEAGGPTEDAPLTASVASRCDVLFQWRDGEADATFGPGQDDRCASATYVCGSLQPAWYGQLACKGWAGCQAPHQAGDAWHSSTDYDVWHFVAAPAASPCNGEAEPGFRTASDTVSSKLPFLAHDLDVFTPPTAGQQATAAGEVPEAWARQVVGPLEGSGQGRLDPGQDGHQVLSSLDAPDPARQAYASLHKEAVPEPNAAGDTSQSITVERTADDCDAVGDDAEQVVDPWVNVIDTRQRYQTWNGMHAATVEPYATTETTQDRNNRPGPGLYLSDGKVGLFTDRDDDGRYDQAAAEAVFTDIREVGAYPMLYDMRLDEDLNPSGGCQASFAQQPIAEAMADAGYGPRTGLVEAIYLKEPTTLVDRRTGDTFPFPEGNTVFVAKTQAIKALEAAGDTVAEDVVEDTIAATGAPADARVIAMDDVKEQPSDFWEQCGEETGRYVQGMMFLHDCTVDCSGDTIATTYVFEVDRPDGTLGGGALPAFQPNGETYAFGSGVHTWTDVDPFDGDPDRNTRDGTPEH